MNCKKETILGRSANSRLFSVIIFAFTFSILSQSICFASTVILQWGSSPGASGYKVYYQADSSAQPFGYYVDAKTQTTATINNLDPTHSYYFAVVAYDTSMVESSYSNIVAINPLSVTLSGSGSGNVNSTPSAISCVSGTCTVQFVNGSTITLIASPTSSSTALSYFSSWSGCSSTNGNSCTVSINAAKNVTANFSSLNPVRNIVNGNYYSSLQTAYSNATGAFTIQAQAVNLTGDFATTSSSKAITLKGGYDATYSGRSGYTEMQGTLSVNKGSLVVDNIVIR